MVLVNFALRFNYSKKKKQSRLVCHRFLALWNCYVRKKRAFDGLEFVSTSFCFLALNSSKTSHAKMKAKSCDIFWFDIQFFFSVNRACAFEL